MQPSSRTPEGDDNTCHVCGHAVRIDPSKPLGDAPCPHCGALLWFVGDAIDFMDARRAEWGKEGRTFLPRKPGDLGKALAPSLAQSSLIVQLDEGLGRILTTPDRAIVSLGFSNVRRGKS